MPILKNIKHGFSLLLMAVASSVLSMLLSVNASAESNDYKYSDTSIKSAYIANIVSFVTNPSTNSSPNNLCIVGDDLIGITLAQTIKEREETSRTQVTKLDHHSSFKLCDLVYIGQNRKDYVRSILFKTKELPALTVSDIEGFNAMGGMVEFIQTDNRIRLGINKKAADAAGIKISSKLLNIAYKVYSND